MLENKDKIKLKLHFCMLTLERLKPVRQWNNVRTIFEKCAKSRVNRKFHAKRT